MDDSIHIEYWWEMPNKWTFQMPKLRSFIEKYIPTDSIVLIPFAGEYRFGNRLDKTLFVYNDLNLQIPADTNIDAKDLNNIYLPETFDCIIADPPYSHYQSMVRYESHMIQNITLWRKTADFLLKKGGIYIELGFNSSGLRQETAKKIALGVCCIGGSHNDILIIIQKKHKVYK